MAYEANRGDNQMSQKERNERNNTNTVKKVADVAIATKNPYAMAAGAAVKVADKATKGKSSEALGKALNRTNQTMPGGSQLQNGINKMNESGMTDKVGQAASMYNGATGATPTTPTNQNTNGTDGSSDSSESSFGGLGGLGKLGGFGGKKQPSSFFDDPNESENPEEDVNNKDTDFLAFLKGTIDIKKVLLPVLPAFGLLMLFLMVISIIGGGVNDFDDALGISALTGEDTGEIVFSATSEDAQAFYERVNDVKLSFQANGKTVDSLKVVAVYHVLNVNNSDYDYDYMTTARIEEIANAMFSGNMYSETTFKDNLINDIFASYFPRYSQSAREQLAEDVFDYIERYYSFIGKDSTLSCAASGSCTYDIKGFYIPGGGNVSKPMQISNLMVRLMECGSPYGNGSYTTPIDQDMVPFEEYVAGVANAEIGSYAPMEALKAQMVAARSFALARPTAMGNAAGKKLEQEGNQWVLQISSCVADQVFCNINEGCSYMGGGDGQGGIVRSGTNHSGAIRTRDALAADHQLRTAAAATEGEVLVNAEGYIISAGYLSTESNKFTNYANSGMNYKQILLEVYNSSARPYGAADVQKMSCNTSGSSSCGNASTGPFASWKQYEGPWAGVYLGNSGKTIKQIGCLATSVAILIAKSGVPTTITDFNPGTFVEYLSKNGGFVSGGNFVWSAASLAAPTFKYQGSYAVSGYSKQQKLNEITELLNNGCYVTAEVKGNTGQHWVAIDTVSGSQVLMMDPGSTSTDLWGQYNWQNTSRLACFKVEG